MGRALDVRKGAINTAVAFIGTENSTATGAFMEKLAGVGGHLQVFREAAVGACQFGFGDRLHEIQLLPELAMRWGIPVSVEIGGA